MKETKKSNKRTYDVKVGCWNCDVVYEISVKKGTMAPVYLFEGGIPCKNCMCDSLKTYNEWVIDKKIMKDVILHKRLEHMEQHDEPTKKHEHFK